MLYIKALNMIVIDLFGGLHMIPSSITRALGNITSIILQRNKIIIINLCPEDLTQSPSLFTEGIYTITFGIYRRALQEHH